MTDIHIIAPFLEANGGDWRAIDLYLSLKKVNNVSLWSSNPPNKTLSAEYPINEVKPYQGMWPDSGTLYVVGSTTEIGHWYEQGKFEKVIVIHNLFLPEALYRSLNRLTLNGTRVVEIQYASKMIRSAIGLPGEIAYPIPRPERFKPLPRPEVSRPFTVGRVSRDIINKFHADDPAFYRRLAEHKMQVSIVGGTCLKPWLGENKNIKLLEEVPQTTIPQILNTFDCFFYRTSLSLKEAFGIVVVEAMLCGLPVVCHRQGGYVEVIQHGVNGFLFDTDEEAFEIIYKLKNDPKLRAQVGQCANTISQNPPSSMAVAVA